MQVSVSFPFRDQMEFVALITLTRTVQAMCKAVQKVRVPGDDMAWSRKDSAPEVTR
jgi:hypothetical protein